MSLLKIIKMVKSGILLGLKDTKKLTKYESLLPLSVTRDTKLAINMQTFNTKESNSNA